METNSNFEKTVRNLNRHQRRGIESTRGIHLLSAEKKTEVAERVVEESIKNNMAEKVIDAFVETLVASPLRVRLRFCFGIIFKK